MADFRRHIPTILATSAFWILLFAAVFLFGLSADHKPSPLRYSLRPLHPPLIPNTRANFNSSAIARLREWSCARPRRLSPPPDSLVQDAITEAGGAIEDADLIAINLAHPLSDGEQIYVPTEGEAPRHRLSRPKSRITTQGPAPLN